MSTWSLAINPTTAGATNVDWTISLSAPYCGRFRIADGVFIQPEAPLAFPDPVPSEDVMFDDGTAIASVQNGVLQVQPSPDRLWPQICAAGDRPFSVELLPSLGLTNPDPGSYAVDVWLGSGSTPTQLPVDVQASAGTCSETADQ
jgi:hypothetical protein